jgi:two-component system, LytTR family, sensor kinase
MSNGVQPSSERDNPFAIMLVLAISYLLMFLHSHVLLRCFLFQRKFLSYFLLFILFMGIATMASVYAFPWMLNRPPVNNVLDTIFSILFNILLGTIIYFLHYYFLEYIKMKEIEILAQQTEIEHLKQQLNPHFLLNALNNLYGVSLSNPMEVPGKIIELTDLLKYQIETSKKDYNTLVDEKKFIEKYITYSKWKLQNITINSTEMGELKNYRVTPMLFLPLVENAIKYSNFDRTPTINIHWTFGDSRFNFTISNMFRDNQSELFSTKSGLKNLKKRLELFHPDSNLEIEEKNNNFTVRVVLWNLAIHA